MEWAPVCRFTSQITAKVRPRTSARSKELGPGSRVSDGAWLLDHHCSHPDSPVAGNWNHRPKAGVGGSSLLWGVDHSKDRPDNHPRQAFPTYKLIQEQFWVFSPCLNDLEKGMDNTSSICKNRENNSYLVDLLGQMMERISTKTKQGDAQAAAACRGCAWGIITSALQH